MEKPTEEELAAALKLAENGTIGRRCSQSEWNNAIKMFKYCKKNEIPSEAAARILAQAYRAELATSL